MPLAFLGALLLLLFLLPQWRQAVGRRSKAGQQINMNSSTSEFILFHETQQKVSNKTSKGILILATDLFLFLFRSDFLFFFFPLGRGESSSSKEGLQAETQQRGHLFYLFHWSGIKCESQQREFSRVRSTFPDFWSYRVRRLCFHQSRCKHRSKLLAHAGVTNLFGKPMNTNANIPVMQW